MSLTVGGLISPGADALTRKYPAEISNGDGVMPYTETCPIDKEVFQHVKSVSEHATAVSATDPHC